MWNFWSHSSSYFGQDRYQINQSFFCLWPAACRSINVDWMPQDMIHFLKNYRRVFWQRVPSTQSLRHGWIGATPWCSSSWLGWPPWSSSSTATSALPTTTRATTGNSWKWWRQIRQTGISYFVYRYWLPVPKTFGHPDVVLSSIGRFALRLTLIRSTELKKKIYHMWLYLVIDEFCANYRYSSLVAAF